MRKTRRDSYKKSFNKDGCKNVIIDSDIAPALEEYCRQRDISCKVYVNNLVREHLPQDMANVYRDMDHESLASLCADLHRQLAAEKKKSSKTEGAES